MTKRRNNNGWMMVEISVVLALLGVFFMLLGESMDTFGRFNRLQLVKQQCLSAGQGQMDSIAATGGPISDGDFERLWPNVSVEIDSSTPTGDWAGLELVKVTTKSRAGRKKIEVQLSRYFTIGRER